ncbi:MAG: tetratricopeptide repeat protein [Planctomycetaceae bacterium]|nr:tetratricopeptide repeat protein [Planctomycetales bacterium]MCB9927143.1 tetratricopeptide repeat protein [Planctomycetaceae bacterium]
MIELLAVSGRSRLCFLLLFSSLTSFVGCTPNAERKRPTTTTVTTSATQEQLLRAMDNLSRPSEFDREQSLAASAYDLNRWLDQQEVDPNWAVDPMASRLPREIRESDLLNDVGKWTFSVDDARAMQEASLLRDLSTWISKRGVEKRIKKWLDSLAPLMDDLDRENLAIAEGLFDWTVRNIQLEATIPYPDESVAPSAAGEQGRDKRIPAPQRAIPGPGYRYPPWEILQYGFGDAEQRSRVFIELARQQGIEVVYLALPGNTVPPRPRPWLTAAVVNRELYLFDCELGLPIPGPNGDGVATLAQVLDDPRLIDALQVGSEKYRFAHDELKELIALIDVSPANLSQRMKLVQANLAGDQRTILAVSPTLIAESLKAARGVADIALWSVPFEAIWFQTAMQRLLQTNREVAAGYYQAVGIFQTRGPLTRGRQLHLQGEFGRLEEGKDGAKGLYMQARVPTAAIDQIATNPEVQKAMGLIRGKNEGDFVWQTRVANSHMLATQSKQHASYWLAIAHYETGNLEAAVTWFQERSIDAWPDGPWISGARYNLARTYESLGRVDEARELYLEDESPQAFGNRLRAKFLKEWSK